MSTDCMMRVMRRLGAQALLAAALVMISAAFVATPAQAGPAADLARKAEAALASGNAIAAYDTMRQAMLAIWERMPFAVQRATFVKQPAGGYGIYNPREAVFKPGEKLLVYIEPVGYGFREAAKGVYAFQIRVDLELADANGKILGGQKEFAKFPMTSRQRNLEFFLSLDLDLGKAPAGRYVLILRLHDDVKGQSAEVKLPFEIKG